MRDGYVRLPDGYGFAARRWDLNPRGEHTPRMDSKRALRWSGYYFLLTTAAAVVGLAIVGAGVALGVAEGYEAYQAGQTTTSALATAAPGLVVALVGIAVWRFGKAWAFYKTLTGATEEQLADTYDTEHVKADILSVLDDRLADMQQDVQSMNRSIRDLKKDDAVEASAEGGFEFEG